MSRLFPIFMATAGLLMVANFIAGMIDPRTDRFLIGMAAGVATLAIYVLASGYLGMTGKKVEVMARRLGLPDWVEAQAEKNRRKAYAYEWCGLPLLNLGAWFDTILIELPWSHSVRALNLAFQLGAFVGLYVAIVAQSRLLRDVEEWARKPETRLVDSVS